LILAIVRNDNDEHIGNIALDKIDYINRCAELAIIMGNKSCWKKGFSKEATRLICDHGFLSLNLHRISCGTFTHNHGMRRLAEYLGMVEEGRRRDARYVLGSYTDIIEYGVLKREYLKRFKLS
jgi:RimJ/RimL family protein N-acetyltransferase